jgi:uncharacterized protein (DUF4415 family)
MNVNSKNIAERKSQLTAPTPEEDAEINRGIAADPDTLDTADPKNARFLKPAPGMKEKVLEIVKRYRGQRGPQKSPTKVPISIRVDADVLHFFQKSGRGWQSKIGALLRKEMERQKPPSLADLAKAIDEGSIRMSERGKLGGWPKGRKRGPQKTATPAKSSPGN